MFHIISDRPVYKEENSGISFLSHYHLIFKTSFSTKEMIPAYINFPWDVLYFNHFMIIYILGLPLLLQIKARDDTERIDPCIQRQKNHS